MCTQQTLLVNVAAATETALGVSVWARAAFQSLPSPPAEHSFPEPICFGPGINVTLEGHSEPLKILTMTWRIE